MRPLAIKLLTVTTSLLSALLLSGCESSPPEFGGGETTSLIEGNLELGQNTQIHLQVVTKTGTINIEATSFTVTLPETGAVLDDYRLGVSVGQRDPNDDTRCQVTFSKTLLAGESFSVYSREGLFCILTFRPPDFEAATTVEYLLTLSGAFS
jgi:hypothetical protein